MPYLTNLFDVVKYKRLIKKTKILNGIGLFISLVFVFYLALSVGFIINNFDEFNPFPKKANYGTAGNQTYVSLPDCSGLDLQETAICLNDFVHTIFIYNITDDDLELTLMDLETRGGDCKDWTDFYQREMRKYGYEADRVRIFVDSDDEAEYYHVFLIARNHEGYCLMDMTVLDCFKYVNDDGETRPKS